MNLLRKFYFMRASARTRYSRKEIYRQIERHAFGVPEPVEKLTFFRQSVFWLRKTRTSESSHAETFSLLEYKNRDTQGELPHSGKRGWPGPCSRFLWFCFAKSISCALPRETLHSRKIDFIDRLRGIREDVPYLFHVKQRHGTDDRIVPRETFCMKQKAKLFHVKHRRGTGRDCFTWNLFRTVCVPRETTSTQANSCFTWNIFRRRKRAGKNFGIVPLFSFKHVL